METLGVQRQKSYLRARPCLFRPRVETREPLEVDGNIHPRYMSALDRIRLNMQCTDPLYGGFLHV